MHLVFKLEAAEHLSRVLLKVSKLVDDLGLVAALPANPVQLVVEAQILEAREELCFLTFCWRLIDDEIDELQGYLAQGGLIGHRER